MDRRNLYKSNSSLSEQIITSIILYLDDMLNPKLSLDSKEQSKFAVLVILDASMQHMNSELSPAARDSLENIFSRVVYDVVRYDNNAIRYDIREFEKIRKML